MFRRAPLRPSFVLSIAAALVGGCASHSDAGPTASPAPTPAVTDTATSAPSPPATCPAGVGVTLRAGKIVANVAIDGHPSIKAVLDTGASSSVFRTGVASADGADVELAGRRVHLDRVYVSDDAIDSLRIPEVRAVLGSDVFADFALTVDYPRSVVMLDATLDEAALAACTHVEPTHDWTSFTMKGDLFVKGAMEDTAGWLLLDTGASLGVLTESAFTTLTAARPHAALTGFYTPAAAGTFWAKLTTVDAISVGGVRVRHIVSRTATDDILGPAPGGAPLLGVVPSDFFAHTMVTFDYPKKRLRLAPAKDDPETLASRFFPIGIGLEEKLDVPIHVANVLAGSAAAEADVAVGDEIVEVGGRRMADLDPYSRAWTVVAGAAGTSIAVKLRRNGVERVVSLVTRDLL